MKERNSGVVFSLQKCYHLSERGKLMVDNRGVTPVSSFNFKSGDISGTAAKTSEEKNDQGTEYFLLEEGEENKEQEQSFQDRSAQLRASLNGLAMANAGSIRFMKTLKEKTLNKIKNKVNPYDYESGEYDLIDENLENEEQKSGS